MGRADSGRQEHSGGIQPRELTGLMSRSKYDAFYKEFFSQPQMVEDSLKKPMVFDVPIVRSVTGRGKKFFAPTEAYIAPTNQTPHDMTKGL